MKTRKRVCSRCVMDTTAVEITFDETGLCSFCQYVDREVKPILVRAMTGEGERILQGLVETIRRAGKSQPYDSLLGLSGGADSSYLAYMAVKMGLRPLFLHVNTGWNSPQSEQNVRKLVDSLGCDFEAVTVDQAEMMDLQLAFYKAGVKNCDIPQDHVFLAVLHKMAAAKGIKYILSGGNLATESILPRTWGYDAGDVAHLKAIHKKFGKLPLRRYPTLEMWERYIWFPFVRGIREVRPLNLVHYDKAAAVHELQEKFGWQEYGAKHYETVQTRFFQGYYLPTKFKIDKRKAHFSSLIVSGQMTREAALVELETDPYPSDALLQSDKATMAKRLGVSLPEWEAILAGPAREHSEFASQERLFQIKDAIVQFLGIRRRRYRW